MRCPYWRNPMRASRSSATSFDLGSVVRDTRIGG